MSSLDFSVEGLEEFYEGASIKITAINSALTPEELDRVYRECRTMLNNYDQAIHRYTQYASLSEDPDTVAQISGEHRQKHTDLVARLHRTVLQRKSELPKVNAREALFAGLQSADSKTNVPKGTADTMGEDISRDLRGMAQTLQEEILRSETSYQIMERSSKRLRNTNESYLALAPILLNSSKLIKNLWQREKSDKFWIISVLIFYAMVVCYILARRLWLASLVGSAMAWIVSYVYWVVVGSFSLGGKITADTIGWLQTTPINATAPQDVHIDL